MHAFAISVKSVCKANGRQRSTIPSADSVKDVSRMPENQPLFYRSIDSVDREVHASKRVRTGTDIFGFAGTSHMIPAVLDEFAAACRHLPIVFLPDNEAPTPVFLVGIRSGQSLFVDESGAWKGRYVPAFLRRYPFILGEIAQSEPVLCVDEASALLSDTDGEALFDQGVETGFLKQIMTLVSGYMEASRRTEAAVKMLREADLFTTVSLEFQNGSGGTNSIQGLWAVDDAKLQSLSEARLLALHSQRLLGPIYAHLLSLGAVEALGDLEKRLN